MSVCPEKPENDGQKSDNYSLKAGLFLATAGGLGLLGGFSSALGSARKQDPQSFDKGLIGQVSHQHMNKTAH